MAATDVPRERSEAEVVERLREVRAGDAFGFQAEVLAGHLSAGAVREFCKPEADLSDWAPLPLACEPVMRELAEYLTFAWGKVEDGLGRTHKAPEGILLDLFTASMLVQIADALGPANRATFEAMSLERAVDVGWRIVAKRSA